MSEIVRTFAPVNSGGVGFTLISPDPIKAAAEIGTKDKQAMKTELTVTCEWSDGVYGHEKAPVAKMKWKRHNTTLANLIEEIKKGRAICPTTRRKDDVPNVHFNVVMFDIDDTFKEMQDYIEGMQVKPTFAYTSPNHKKNDGSKYNGQSRFRLVYVFEQHFSGSRFAQIYNWLVKVNNLSANGLDARVANQMYYGNDMAEWWYGETLATPSDEQIGTFCETVEPTATASVKRQQKKNRVLKETPFAADLIKDYCDLSLTDFKRKHLDEIPFILTETNYVEVEGRDYLVPDGIRCKLPRYRNGLKRNHDRNKTLYVACIVMQYLNPSLTADDYLIAMVDEFLTYYIEDEKWSKYRLLQQIVYCWHLYKSGTRPTENKRMPATKPNPKYCKDNRISKRNHAPKASKHHRWDTAFNPADFYDPTQTIAENIEAIASPTKWLKAYGFSGKKIARNTLIAALREQHIKTYEERKEEAIVCAYIWGADSPKALQMCGDFTIDPKTARKRFNDFESGRTSDVRNAAAFYFVLNRVSRQYKKKNTKGILSIAIQLE